MPEAAGLSFQELPDFSATPQDPTPATLIFRWPGRNGEGTANAVGEVLQGYVRGNLGGYTVLELPGGGPRRGASSPEGFGSPTKPTAKWFLKDDAKPRDFEGGVALTRYVLIPNSDETNDVLPVYHVLVNPDGELVRVEGRTASGCQANALSDGIHVFQMDERNATVAWDPKTGDVTWRDGNTGQMLARVDHPDYWTKGEAQAAVYRVVTEIEPTLRRGLLPLAELQRAHRHGVPAIRPEIVEAAMAVEYAVNTGTRDASRTLDPHGHLVVPGESLLLPGEAPLAIDLDHIRQLLAARSDTPDVEAAAVVDRAREFLGPWAIVGSGGREVPRTFAEVGRTASVSEAPSPGPAQGPGGGNTTQASRAWRPGPKPGAPNGGVSGGVV